MYPFIAKLLAASILVASWLPLVALASTSSSESSPSADAQSASAGEEPKRPSEAASSENQAPKELELNQDEYNEILKALGQTDASASVSTPVFTASSSTVPALSVAQTQSTMNPAIALIFDVALAYFSDEDPLQTGAHDPTATGFTLQQLELHAESKVDQHFDLQANLVFSQYGVEIEELYAQTLSLPYSLQLRAGQYLLPFGRINQTHPHTWSFVDQALSVGTFLGGEGGRGLGIETSWLLPLPWYSKLTASVNQNAGECCAKSFVTGAPPKVEGLNDLLYTARLEQFYELSDNWSVLAGLSYLLGENQTGRDNQSHIRAVDFFVKYKPITSTDRFYVSMQLEWFQRDRQVPGRNFKSQTGYVELKSGLNPYWEIAARTEWLGKFQAKRLDDALEGERYRHTGQVTYRPSHFSRLRLQLSQDRPQWREDPIWSSMLALEVLVGAHGAHTY